MLQMSHASRVLFLPPCFLVRTLGVLVVHDILVAMGICCIRCVVSAVDAQEDGIVPAVIHQCVVEALTAPNLALTDILKF